MADGVFFSIPLFFFFPVAAVQVVASNWLLTLFVHTQVLSDLVSILSQLEQFCPTNLNSDYSNPSPTH
jgi:hypothetical protein